MRKGVALLGAGMLLTTATAAAQEPRVEDTDLPRHVADEVIAFFNDPGTIRFSGRSGVPAGRRVMGDVAVLGGPFALGGEIEGSLIVVNGDLTVETGSVVSGDVTVVGGEVFGPAAEAVGGTLSVYEQGLRYSRRGDRITYEGQSPRRRRSFRDLGFGSSRFTVRSGINYNRVEGLPVLFGPLIRTSGANPLYFDALAIWRTDYGLRLADEEMGYHVRLEQRLGEGGTYAIGGTLHSEIQPIERWGLSDVEASLATFLLHEDYRDYYDRDGWSAYLRVQPPDAPLSFSLVFRSESYGFAPARSPWSLQGDEDPWRPQPLVAAGALRSVGGEITFDDRNDPDRPSDGWLAEARLRLGVDGTLQVPEHELALEDGVIVPSRSFSSGIASGFLSVARYNRVGPYSQLSFRGILGGSLDGDPLPPQFQHALGGEGSLPGYPLMSGDCGARDRESLLEMPEGDLVAQVPAFSTYGCDRMALFQAEYRGTFFIDFGWGDEEDDWDFWSGVFVDPTWTVFFDAGRGWSLADDADGGFLGRDSETLADVGVGFFFGEIGMYWAYPLRGEDRGINFFIRLDRRF